MQSKYAPNFPKPPLLDGALKVMVPARSARRERAGRLLRLKRSSQIAFAHHTLVRLLGTFYPVLQLPGPLWKLTGHNIGSAGDIAAQRGREVHRLTDLESVGRHRALQQKCESSNEGYHDCHGVTVRPTTERSDR